VVAAAGEKLLEVGLSEAAALEALSQQAPAVMAWLAAYMPAATESYQQTQMQGGGGTAGPHARAHGAACGMPLGAPVDAGSSMGMGVGSMRACITSVADIEENIWSPKFGLKGQLDASLVVQLTECEPARVGRSSSWPQARHGGAGSGGGGAGSGGAGGFSGGANNGGVSFKGWGHSASLGGGGRPEQPLAPLDLNAAAGAGPAAARGGPSASEAAAHGLVITRQQQLLAPFEFKTGKDYFTHRAQVSLYLLLMEERYRAPVSHGLLWNVHQQKMQLVPRKPQELAPLLARRNALAAHLWQERPAAPPMLRDANACRRCHSAGVCATYHAVVERGGAESAGMEPGQFEALAGHTTAEHGAFVAHWMGLVDWEEAGARARRSGIWALAGGRGGGGWTARPVMQKQECQCGSHAFARPCMHLSLFPNKTHDSPDRPRARGRRRLHRQPVVQSFPAAHGDAGGHDPPLHLCAGAAPGRGLSAAAAAAAAAGPPSPTAAAPSGGAGQG
jgi:hypothetical protein